jgi:hypothetical protein
MPDHGTAPDLGVTPPFNATPRELVTVKEFAAMVRRSEKTIYRLARAGQLAGARRIGGQWVIDVSIELPRE